MGAELLLLLGVLAVLQVLTFVAVIWLKRRAPVPEVDAAESDRLRHAHRYGPKDADMIRYCACGDRYLDGIR